MPLFMGTAVEVINHQFASIACHFIDLFTDILSAIENSGKQRLFWMFFSVAIAAAWGNHQSASIANENASFVDYLNVEVSYIII